MLVIPPIDAGNDVESDFAGVDDHLDGGRCAFEGTWDTPHPVVVRLKPVQTDGHCAEAALQQALVALRRQAPAVRDHSPGELLLVHHPAAGLQVGTHQRFTAGDVDHHLVRIHRGADAVENLREILHRHIRRQGRLLAVAAAVAAVVVTAQGTFPEKLPELMLSNQIILQLLGDIQCDTTPERKSFFH